MPEETLNQSAEQSSAGANTGSDTGNQTQETQVQNGGETQHTPENQGQQQSAATPGSAPGKDAKQNPQPTARSVVADLFKKSGKGGIPSDPNKPQEGQADPNKPGAIKDGAEGEENQQDDPLHKHPRFQELIKERNTIKEQLKAAEPELQDYRDIRTFMTEQNLTDQEVNTGLKIWAALKNDPVKAAEMIAPYLSNLNSFLGVTLPANLQQQVDEGLITPQAARQLVLSQNQNHQLQNQQLQQRQHQEQQAQAQQQQQHVASVRNAIGGWETTKKKSDPDYDKTYPFFETAIRVEFQKQPPRSPQEAVDLANRVYEQVRKNLLGSLPRRQPITPLPNNTSSHTGRLPQPKNAREAVAQALAKTRSS